jgi:hypothetical protein
MARGVVTRRVATPRAFDDRIRKAAWALPTVLETALKPSS